MSKIINKKEHKLVFEYAATSCDRCEFHTEAPSIQDTVVRRLDDGSFYLKLFNSLVATPHGWLHYEDTDLCPQCAKAVINAI